MQFKAYTWGFHEEIKWEISMDWERSSRCLGWMWTPMVSGDTDILGAMNPTLPHALYLIHHN